MITFKPQAWHVETRFVEQDWYSTHPTNPDFKPQRWHLIVKPGGLLKGEEFVVESFATRKVAEESRDEWNADPTHVRDRGDAYICLCDCQDRECDYL